MQSFRLNRLYWFGTALFCLVMGIVVRAETLSKGFVLGHGSGQLILNANGALLRWIDRPPTSSQDSASAGEMHYEGRLFRLTNPRCNAHGPKSCSFEYAWPGEPAFSVTIRHVLARKKGAWTWTRTVQVKGPGKLESDLTISVDSGIGQLPKDSWLPLINGVGATLATNKAAEFRLAGAVPDSGAVLAFPMVSLPPRSNAPHRLTLAADPYFSTVFISNSMAWTYLAAEGLENGCENRTIVVSSHDGGPEKSIETFYDTVLGDLSPGPKWLHEIAMVDYDYMSHGGHGWFSDIDALATVIPESDRKQVLFCLHGWYDFLGRYCFDPKAKKFDREWMVFSNYDAAQKAAKWGTIGGDRVNVGFAGCKPLKMSMSEVHRRLKYARARGFRVGIYFADGMNAGDGLPYFDKDCVLEWGGWPGADVQGRSYVQNPLHPKVRNFYIDYAKAMLDEFGADIDMLNWDETFHIPIGRLGTPAAPGYADRAGMRLAHDLTTLVDDYNRTHRSQIAFLTSDCLGAVYGPKDKAPYALMSHGTYQDSWCQPHAWSYGIFANYRNVLWSLCWWPITKWSWIEFGVRNYQAAVSLSNGWGDDTGFSQMTAEERAQVLALFDWRKKQSTHLRWFTELPLEPASTNVEKASK